MMAVMVFFLALLLAPLYSGWIKVCRARWQGKRSTSVLLPYWTLLKLLRKEPVIRIGTTPMFVGVPYLVFACLALALAQVPLLGTELPWSETSDVIALVGTLALARVFLALGAMDTGTAFASMGARREMLMAFLAEPALLSVLFTLVLMTQSTTLAHMAHSMLDRPLALNPSLAFAAVAYTMVFLAENGRIPVDNPTTHLELTMIHEAMLLEYSGRYLALLEWGQSVRLLIYTGMGISLFMPWGMALGRVSLLAAMLSLAIFMFKCMVMGILLAGLEVMSAKLRIFRVPEFLGMAFIFGVLGMFVHVLMETF